MKKKVLISALFVLGSISLHAVECPSAKGWNPKKSDITKFIDAKILNITSSENQREWCDLDAIREDQPVLISLCFRC